MQQEIRFANWLSYQKTTSCLSNVGKVKMPQEMIKYIRLFDLFVSTGVPDNSP